MTKYLPVIALTISLAAAFYAFQANSGLQETNQRLIELGSWSIVVEERSQDTETAFNLWAARELRECVTTKVARGATEQEIDDLKLLVEEAFVSEAVCEEGDEACEEDTEGVDAEESEEDVEESLSAKVGIMTLLNEQCSIEASAL